MSIKELVNPKSIALVGASEASGWSQALVANFRSLGYQGSWHLVNPRYEEQFGLPSYPSLSAVPEQVDCAYVMTGTEAVPGVLEDCARAGVKHAILLTAGYKEIGPEGAARERALVEQAERLGITVQGPNCLGYLNYRRGIGAYALPVSGPLLAGGVGLLTQSGALLLHFHRLAQFRAIGVSYVISSGNEAMLDANDFLEFLLEDPETKVVGAMLEGIRRPRRFRELAERARQLGKPLVVLKVGRSEGGARSAIAHTGALAVEDRVVDGIFKHHAVVRVESPEELIETCAVLSQPRQPEGNRFAMLTASGGACGILADLAQKTALALPDFGPQTKRELAEILPVFGTPQNPLDTTGLIVLDMTLLPRALEVIGRDPGYDAVLVVWDVPREPGLNPERTVSRLAAVAEAVKACPLPTFLSSYTAGELTPYGRDLVVEHGLHFIAGMPMAVAALDHAVRLNQARPATGSDAPASLPTGLQRGTWSEVRSLEFVAQQAGIPIPPLRLAQSAEEAAGLAAEVGFPCVLKVQSPDIPHKAQAGGVKLGVSSAAAAADAYREIVAAAGKARMEGVLIVPQVSGALEMIVGTTQTEFGPMVLVGSGRNYAMRPAGLGMEEALAMLAEIQDGRDESSPDDEVAKVLVALGRLAGAVKELDVNPLFVLPQGKGVLAGDALVVVE